MSITDKIDHMIREYVREHDKSPRRVVLHALGIVDFLEDAKCDNNYFVGLPPRCPHCGKYILTYKGIPVDVVDRGDVFVE